ncbi:hypothetical protein ACJX0J_019310 [Zea mays]
MYNFVIFKYLILKRYTILYKIYQTQFTLVIIIALECCHQLCDEMSLIPGIWIYEGPNVYYKTWLTSDNWENEILEYDGRRYMNYILKNRMETSQKHEALDARKKLDQKKIVWLNIGGLGISMDLLLAIVFVCIFIFMLI